MLKIKFFHEIFYNEFSLGLPTYLSSELPFSLRVVSFFD
jgi:hypothetical protein